MVYGLVALLFVIVNLVLLIACINLAGMLLARAVARPDGPHASIRLSLSGMNKPQITRIRQIRGIISHLCPAF